MKKFYDEQKKNPNNGGAALSRKSVKSNKNEARRSLKYGQIGSAAKTLIKMEKEINIQL